MKVFKRIIIGVFLLSLIALYIIIYAAPGVTGALEKTEILQYGSLKISDNVTCYFIRNEKVYSAIGEGAINYYVGDSVLVKKGTKILDIAREPIERDGEQSGFKDIMDRLGGDAARLADCVSEFNGVTSYYIDGYENYFTPDSMRGLKYDAVSGLHPSPVNVVRSDTLEGEPLYKICDSKKWYVVCWIGAANISKYVKGKSVTLNLPLGDLKATIDDIIQDGDKWLIIMSTDRYYEDFAKARAVQAEVVPANYDGLVIRNMSITVSDGVVGVYIKAKNGDFVFKPIKVITTDGQNSLVEASYYYDNGDKVSTVNIYDEILINPARD